MTQRYALVYSKPILFRLPENWGKLSIKQKHAYSKDFHDAVEARVYETFVQAKVGHPLEELEKACGAQ